MTVYFVTHPEKLDGPNPGLGENGRKVLEQMKLVLPGNLTNVVVGTGKRNLETAAALGLKPTRISPVVGLPDSMVMVEGQEMIILADGTPIPTEIYKEEDLRPSLYYLFRYTLEPRDVNSIVCGGRGSLLALGFQAESGKLYEVYFTEMDFIAIHLQEIWPEKKNFPMVSMSMTMTFSHDVKTKG